MIVENSVRDEDVYARIKFWKGPPVLVELNKYKFPVPNRKKHNLGQISKKRKMLENTSKWETEFRNSIKFGKYVASSWKCSMVLPSWPKWKSNSRVWEMRNNERDHSSVRERSRLVKVETENQASKLSIASQIVMRFWDALFGKRNPNCDDYFVDHALLFPQNVRYTFKSLNRGLKTRHI